MNYSRNFVLNNAKTYFCLISLLYVNFAYTIIKQIHYTIDLSCGFDSLTQQSLRNKIRLILEQEPNVLKALETIKQQIPCINDLIFQKKKPFCVQISCMVDKPVGIINNEQVLFSKGTYLSKSSFNEYVTDKLPHCYVPHDQVEKDALIAYLEAMPAELISAIEIHWKKPTNILIKEQSNNFMICTCASKSLHEIMQLRDMIKKSIEITQGKKGKNNKGKWIADVRFNRQVILYAT